MVGNQEWPPKVEYIESMYGPDIKDTFQRFDKLKMLEHDLALSYEMM